MIHDTIKNARRYYCVHSHFERALGFLKTIRIAAAERVALEGENVFVLFSQQQGKKRTDAFLEAHKKYIDIHFCIEGEEEIGWRALSTCVKPDMQYDAGKDFMTFHDQPESWSTLTPGTFAIYFPEDSHAPMVGDGIVKKAVVKVAIVPL